jgi:hypothetical protein
LHQLRFQLINANYIEVVALIKTVFLRLVAKRGDRFLEQRIKITFCEKLGKNATDTCAMLSEAYGGIAMKKSRVLSGINSSKRARMSESQMQTMPIIFFHIKNIPQGQTVNQAFYVEILKWLRGAVR